LIKSTVNIYPEWDIYKQQHINYNNTLKETNYEKKRIVAEIANASEELT
jgi:hypothetical protein